MLVCSNCNYKALYLPVLYTPFTLQVFVPGLEVFVGGGTTPKSPHVVRVSHTTGGRPLIGHGLLTVNNSRMTVLQMMIPTQQPQLSFGSHRMKQPIP